MSRKKKAAIKSKDKPEATNTNSTQEHWMKGFFLHARWVIVAVAFLMSTRIHWSHSTSQKSTKDSDTQSLLKDRISILNELIPQEVEVDGRILRPEELQIAETVNSSSRVYRIDSFLSPEECDGLTGVHKRLVNDLSRVPALVCYDGLNTFQKHLQLAGNIHMRASDSDFIKGTKCVNETMSVYVSSMMPTPWSFSTAFYPGESPFSHTLTERLSAIMGLLPSHGGKFQVTSYPTGAGYGYHTDCVLNNTNPTDRIATALVYLQDVPSGGETEFPVLGIRFKPRKGTALIWTNMDHGGSCDRTTLHQAAPVLAGYKFILQRWYYYRRYYNLGVRMEEPPLPQRKLNQARLSCTGEEDCRWFDEWGTDHLRL